MSANLKSIVVSYNVHDETFHRESLLEYTQGNAIRILKNRPAHYHAIAVVETNDEAERAIAFFSKHLRVARGIEEPLMLKPRTMAVSGVKV